MANEELLIIIFIFMLKMIKNLVVSPKESSRMDKSKTLLVVFIAMMGGGCGQIGSSPEEMKQGMSKEAFEKEVRRIYIEEMGEELPAIGL
ncbi:hypothetical protein [Shouchella clausii]|uniref:hypothetical protein n=1 Tax=Shouchella clausii TaxID=79880 RepID=UPI0032EE1856